MSKGEDRSEAQQESLRDLAKILRRWGITRQALGSVMFISSTLGLYLEFRGGQWFRFQSLVMLLFTVTGAVFFLAGREELAKARSLLKSASAEGSREGFGQ